MCGRGANKEDADKEVGTKGVGVRKLLKHSRKQIEGQRRHSKRWWGKGWRKGVGERSGGKEWGIGVGERSGGKGWGKERQEGRWGGGAQKRRQTEVVRQREGKIGSQIEVGVKMKVNKAGGTKERKDKKPDRWWGGGGG